MDGKTLKDQLRLTLRELTNSEFIDEKTSYDYLYEAALELGRLTQALNATQAITTVAGTSTYKLNSDFYSLRLVNDRNEWIVKCSDGTSDSWPSFRGYESLLYSNVTDTATIPANISVTDWETVGTNISGTASVTGSTSEAEPVLTSVTSFANVSVGDMIHNTTDGSDGVVIEVTSGTSLKTNLFHGTNNFWTSGDAFVIVPMGRKALVVSPPSGTSGLTITVPYVQSPIPVYSDFRSYRFDPAFGPALIKYAAWLYKYRDDQPNFGDAWYKFFVLQAKGRVHDTNKSYDRTRFRVNMIRRSLHDRSYR
jgi:hypothetical protein